MMRRTFLVCLLVSAALSVAGWGDTKAASKNLTAAEVVDRNVSARGGLRAWRAVSALSFTGQMEAGGNNRPGLPMPGPKHGAQLPPQRPSDQVRLPFVMDMQRPHKTRLEIQFNGQAAVQVFDGTNGWKLRPFLNRNDVEPYTADEMKAASLQEELDGPLVDYAAKGTKIELAGLERVQGRDNYNLKLTAKDGSERHIWIDAETFLETKMEGNPRKLDGLSHPVEVYFRDYRPTDGLMIPYLLETHVLPIKNASVLREITEKVVIDKVTVNPKFAESLFTKPQAQAGNNSKQTASVGAHSLP